jgi:drug/metabolite transporter (DMT)-like permease
MKTTIGIVLLVIGVLLLVSGYQTADSLKGRVQSVFQDAKENKSTWLYVGGAGACVAGAFMLYTGKK